MNTPPDFWFKGGRRFWFGKQAEAECEAIRDLAAAYNLDYLMSPERQYT